MKTLTVVLENVDKGYIFSEWNEELEEDLTMGDVYRLAQKEYGRCQSKVYVDTADGTEAIGWYFLKRDTYDDYRSNDTYLRGAWVTVS